MSVRQFVQLNVFIPQVFEKQAAPKRAEGLSHENETVRHVVFLSETKVFVHRPPPTTQP